jgi:hypothetical protein
MHREKESVWIYLMAEEEEIKGKGKEVQQEIRAATNEYRRREKEVRREMQQTEAEVSKALEDA